MSKVLVVEDDFNIADLVKTILEEDGYTVITVPSAEKAKETIAIEQPALALIDMVLPGQGGMDLILELHEAWPDLGIILTSGKIDVTKSSVKILARQFGVRSVLPKPFTIEELLSTVREADGKNTPT